mmetsp:Transcript_35153/g.74797  ORF Transcript_35153/g.74797 Transcript_35153/m.74797 type:complete len:208 (+) Transcript_35153:3080-3703(+)
MASLHALARVEGGKQSAGAILLQRDSGLDLAASVELDVLGLLLAVEVGRGGDGLSVEEEVALASLTGLREAVAVDLESLLGISLLQAVVAAVLEDHVSLGEEGLAARGHADPALGGASAGQKFVAGAGAVGLHNFYHGASGQTLGDLSGGLLLVHPNDDAAAGGTAHHLEDVATFHGSVVNFHKTSDDGPFVDHQCRSHFWSCCRCK